MWSEPNCDKQASNIHTWRIFWNENFIFGWNVLTAALLYFKWSMYFFICDTFWTPWFKILLETGYYNICILKYQRHNILDEQSCTCTSQNSYFYFFTTSSQTSQNWQMTTSASTKTWNNAVNIVCQSIILFSFKNYCQVMVGIFPVATWWIFLNAFVNSQVCNLTKSERRSKSRISLI